MKAKITFEFRREYPCPCGKGKWVHEWNTNDWQQVKGERQTMICAKCKGSYVFDTTPIRYGSKPHKLMERGWVLKPKQKRPRRKRGKTKMSWGPG
jgi:hypothetical protein